ncbi:DNA-binding transcriptional regulator, MarR family [Antarctobacter heliothermus]|uniref:DNA-binding transcriptional regulator, MarR family n=2 Tax=Antarctobacter heliothermus TaxID=74033 RepID=A0A239ENF1_9RHOB|nr:DNA-binding transcriptional regulator, MarR family [Antarctobacter heliothermus]
MGPVSQSDIASAFGVTPASMSTMTDRLLSAGYITRAVDPGSRRRHILELTDTGRTLLNGIGDAWTAVDDGIRASLGADAETLFELARRLRDGLGGKIPGDKNADAGIELPPKLKH